MDIFWSTDLTNAWYIVYDKRITVYGNHCCPGYCCHEKYIKEMHSSWNIEKNKCHIAFFILSRLCIAILPQWFPFTAWEQFKQGKAILCMCNRIMSECGLNTVTVYICSSPFALWSLLHYRCCRKNWWIGSK